MKLRTVIQGIVFVSMLSAAVVCRADIFEISAEQWARPRSGERVIEIVALQNLVHLLDERADTRVAVHHAGGDEGLLWAVELRGWLIALGVPGNRISLRSGLQIRDRLVLETEQVGLE